MRVTEMPSTAGYMKSSNFIANMAPKIGDKVSMLKNMTQDTCDKYQVSKAL